VELSGCDQFNESDDHALGQFEGVRNLTVHELLQGMARAARAES
jgi:hypothetical protein